MIVTSRLLEYPLLAIAPGMQKKLASANNRLAVKPAITAYLNCYFHIVGIHLDDNTFSSIDEIDETLYGLEGFLLSTTNFTNIFVAQIRTKAKVLLAATIGVKWTRENHGVKNTITARQQVSVSFYKLNAKSDALLRYYSGWWIECRDGKIKFANLIDFYGCYGEQLTDQILELIKSHLIKFSHNTCHTKLVHLKRITKMMCTLYPNKEKLLLLQTGKNVNEFVEILFTNLTSYTISNGFDLKSFYYGWPMTIGLFNDMLTGTVIMSKPEWPLLCPTYTTASEHDVKEDQTIFEKAFIDVPLTFSDEQAFNSFESAINDELSFIEKCCFSACSIEINKYNEITENAKLGKVISNFSKLESRSDFTTYDVCRTWLEYKYNIADTGIFSVITKGEFFQIARPLRANTLLPFMHVLVQHHPIITPPWLIEFELFDSSGQQVNYTQSGENWIATSFKPRAKGHEQQSVVLTKVTKQIFDDIILLTKDARDYLKSIGDDSYRRLFLSGGRGFQKPAPIDTIAPVGRMDSDIFMRAVMVGNVSETFSNERVGRIINRLSLRSLRDAVAIQVFLRTISMEAVAVALGHAPGNAESGEVYIPSALRFYMMDRWIRLFQNAIVYEAMKDSPYLLHAVDFNTLEELNEFLHTHKKHYKVIPDNESATSQFGTGLKVADHDRMYIELNLAKLEVLLCIYEVIYAALKTGIEIVAAAMRWYPIATLLYRAVHLHKEGTLSSYCSRSVLALFSKANPSEQLLEKIKDVVHA
ncbi:hypothetical protein ALP70_01057 [Pseudomonas savastanoi]|uniref:Uncharacterized protein n=1 Tax=Pseudomonas savastanoi TaxID=29438 RepID=A0A3M5BLX7_PSESS|nr:hypothetical protein ALP70_01057 [Pseudomonas savastanoi]